MAGQGQGQVDIGQQPAQDFGHALLAGTGQPPGERAPNQYRIRAQGHCLEYVRTTTDAAVEEYGHMVAHGIHHARQGIDRGNAAIDLAPAMVGHDHAVHAGTARGQRVFGV